MKSEIGRQKIKVFEKYILKNKKVKYDNRNTEIEKLKTEQNFWKTRIKKQETKWDFWENKN